MQHIGIASTDGGFGSAKGDAVYHYHSVREASRNGLTLYAESVVVGVR